jgi:glycosyltransferase involved in cell wall biosynthesis
LTLAVLTGVLGAPSETFIARHIAHLAPGHTVVVARRRAAEPTWQPETEVLLLDELQDAWWGEIERAALDAFLRDHGVEVVLAEFLDLWIGAIDVLRTGRRVVGHAHGYDASQRLRDEHWRSAYVEWNSIEHVVAPSVTLRDNLVGAGLETSLLHVVPYGVPVPDVLPVRSPADGHVGLLAVGRLVPKKDPLATIEAVRLASERGAPVSLDLIGDGPLLDDARAAIERDRAPVRLHGAQTNEHVRQAMAGADIFVQHSRTDPATGDEEGMPVAVLEALASGLPVVSTRHAGIAEAVVEGVTGLLVDEGDIDGMADALVDLASDADRRRDMGDAGWRRATARYSIERERDDLRALLGLA